MREELWLESRTGTPVIANDTLVAGMAYRLSMQGTFTVWSSLATPAANSGEPEAKPMWPSVTRSDMSVGLDPEFRFAWPSGSSLANSSEPSPRRGSSIQFSLDGGETWKHLESSAPYNPRNHTYLYDVEGAGHPLQVRFVDSPYSDNNGRIKIIVQSAGRFDPERLATGGNHSLVAMKDGSIMAFGEGRKGQLGDGAATNRYAPVQVTQPGNVVVVGAGQDHSLAITADGRLWAWGDNGAGQLGVAASAESTRPSPGLVPGLEHVIQVAGGQKHTLALTRDGKVYAWGDNSTEQLGGAPGAAHEPSQVPGLPVIRLIATGNNHNLVLASDGTVWTWGENRTGQLGDGTRQMRAASRQVEGLPADIRDITAGDNFSLALAADGTVWGWGQGDTSSLGEDAAMKEFLPRKVSKLDNVVSISAGDKHTVALTADGKVFAWGMNPYGELGNGSTENSATPVQVSGLSDVAGLSADIGQHTLAVTGDAKVWGWGRNHVGQLGNKDLGQQATTPAQIPGLTAVS